MRVRLAALAWALGILIAIAAPVHAGSPSPTTTPSPAIESPTVLPSDPASPPSGPTAVPIQIPIRLISTDGSLRGAFVREDGGAVRTLVDLFYNARLVDGDVVAQESSRVVVVRTDEQSMFSFTNMPAGDYVLWLWWGGGFTNVTAVRGHPGVFRAEITVDTAGNVSGAIPEQFEVGAVPAGVVGYPVRNPAPTVFEGSVNVAEQLGLSPISLPPTGHGANMDPPTSVRLATVVGGVMAVCGCLALRRVRSA